MAHTFIRKARAEGAPPKTPIRILRGGELLALRPPPWLIERLLGMLTLALLYASPEAGKSFVALHFALCIANGLRCFGRKVRQGAVVYIAAEGGARFKRRVQAWIKEHPAVEKPTRNFFCVTESLNFREEKLIDDLIASIEVALHQQKPLLLIVDTLARCMVGGDENSSQDMGRVIHACERLQQTFGCTLLLLHHPGKNASKGERGSSSLPGALDTRMFLKKTKTDGKELRAYPTT